MLTTFAYLLGTARVDANIVFGKAKKYLSAWDFVKKLARQLVLSYVKKRKPTGLNVLVLSKTRIVSGEPPKTESTQVDSEQHQRCRYCLNETRDKGQKKKKDGLGQSIICSKCSNAICKKKQTIKPCLDFYDK